MKLKGLLFFLVFLAIAADLPGSQDPPLMKRYAGSEIIGYRAPKFDEYLMPLGKPTSQDPPADEKSQKMEGLLSRYTYVAPEGRTPAEVFRNYQLEFQRMNLVTMYEKGANAPGWFGPTLGQADDEDGLKQILTYNEAQERVLTGKSKDAQPVWYFVFITAYKDGLIPDRLQGVVKKDRTLIHIAVMAPEKLEHNMEFVNAADMARALNALDRDVDCTHARATVTAPDVMQQSLAAVSTLGTAHQELEQLELHVAQRDRLVDDRDPAPICIHPQLTKLQVVRIVPSDPHWSQHRPHTGDDFRNGERLDDVVVHAELEARNDMIFARKARQRD